MKLIVKLDGSEIPVLPLAGLEITEAGITHHINIPLPIANDEQRDIACAAIIRFIVEEANAGAALEFEYGNGMFGNWYRMSMTIDSKEVDCEQIEADLCNLMQTIAEMTEKA